LFFVRSQGLPRRLSWIGYSVAKYYDWRKEFWLDDYAVNIWSKRDIGAVTDKTYFAHVKNLEWAEQLRNIQK